MKSETLKVVTMQGCPFCTKTKELLSELGQPYEEIEAGTTDGRTILENVGSRGVPVLLKGDQHVIGFQPERIRVLLING